MVRRIDGEIEILLLFVIRNVQHGLASGNTFKCISDAQPHGHFRMSASGINSSLTI